MEVDDGNEGDVELEDLNADSIKQDIAIDKDAIKIAGRTGRNVKQDTMAGNAATEYGDSELLVDSQHSVTYDKNTETNLEDSQQIQLMPSEMSLWDDEANPKMQIKSKFIGVDDDIPVNRYQQRTSTV